MIVFSVKRPGSMVTMTLSSLVAVRSKVVKIGFAVARSFVLCRVPQDQISTINERANNFDRITFNTFVEKQK